MRSQPYRDLLVWQNGIELCIKVYEACRINAKLDSQ
jgi:hypothetical protein